MKTSLDHLPPEKRAQLGAVVALLRDAAPVESVVLFGSYARGDWVEDPISGYQSDFDLLIVVESHALAEKGELWADVENRAEQMPGMTPVNLIVHDFKYVNKQIERGQYFFADVVDEGVLLYDSRKFTFTARRPPTPEERKAQMEDDFEYWSTSASQFFTHFDDDLKRGWNNLAAFNLHQAAERYFAALLLVTTAYKPRTHNLEKLANSAASLHPDLRGALPRTEPEDRRLFDLLKKAYVDARYKKRYRITEEELRVLGERVEDLGARVKRACAEKIGGLE